MSTEWIVAAVLLFVGLVAAVGIYLGERDPVTRAYKPGNLVLLGRISFRSPFGEKQRQDATKRGEGHGNNANDGGSRASRP